MKKKNLIFFLPDFQYGGGGKSITSLCRNLDKKKFRITIICLNQCFYKNQLKNFCKIYEIQSKKVIIIQKISLFRTYFMRMLLVPYFKKNIII